jgi:hypothetical protein
LVDLHEREIRALLAHGIPIKIQKAAFEEAMKRVVRSTVAVVVEVSAESWRAPAQKSSKALSVYQALPAEMSSQSLQPELNQSPARRAADRVVEIWNSNSRDKAVTLYTSRTAGVARLWKASQLLEGGTEPSDAEGPRSAKPAKRTQPAMKAQAANKAAPTKKARDKPSARSNKKRRLRTRSLRHSRKMRKDWPVKGQRFGPRESEGRGYSTSDTIFECQGFRLGQLGQDGSR